GKRMLVIHELYHATGSDHKSIAFFTHGLDLFTLEFYKEIYGEDLAYQDILQKIKEVIKTI
ncbi:MAG: hypothetical protein ACREHC_08925, partial [Candidatus Levyibacteriota bacterium]